MVNKSTKKAATNKPSPKKPSNVPSDNEDALSEPESTNPNTKADLDILLKNQLKEIQASYNETIEKLQATIDRTALLAENATKRVQELENELDKTKTEVSVLKGENKRLKEKVNNVSSNQHSLEERIEDRTNRQLRKTLVFRGIPEQPSTATDGAETATHKTESWQETKDLLADQISEICALPKPDAAAMLERAHRSAPNPRYKGTAPRPIYVALFDWNQSQLCIEKFRQHNITNKNSKILCEQKYGPITTQRRNQAMMMRKELKDSGEIVAGYVAFPARLMAKTSHREGSKYTMVRDFSREPVTLGKRD